MKPWCTSQFQLRPAPPGYCRHFPALSVLGVGHLQILHCAGAGHLPTPGPLASFSHALSFLSEYDYTEGFTERKKQIGSPVKDRNKLKRVVEVCSRFYACTSSLLIQPELHSENRSYRCESTCFGYWIKFLLILFEEHLFTFIKLFITYCYSALLILMSIVLYQ